MENSISINSNSIYYDAEEKWTRDIHTHVLTQRGKEEKENYMSQLIGSVEGVPSPISSVA
jgi:hypothetical protein